MSFFFDILPASIAGLFASSVGSTASAGALGLTSGLTYGAATLPASFSAVGGAAGAAAAAASAASGGVGLATAGLTAAQAASLGLTAASTVSTGLQMGAAGSAAAAERAALGMEGDFAEESARAEADAERQDLRRHQARGVALYGKSGVVRGEGSPLLYEMETAREIGQRYSDRLYRGQVSRYGSNLRVPGVNATQNARMGSIATGYFRSLLS